MPLGKYKKRGVFKFLTFVKENKILQKTKKPTGWGVGSRANEGRDIFNKIETSLRGSKRKDAFTA